MKPVALRSTVQEEMNDWFETLDLVHPAELIGLWRGNGYPSGHPLDGVLENLHWFGKRFHPDKRADALLFESNPGKLLAVDPAFFPIKWALLFAGIGRTKPASNLFTHILPRLRARGTTAALEERLDAGVMTAAMVYDKQPIVDYFRRTANGDIIGKMVVKGDPDRYFFGLQRVGEGTET
ncbi:hypothetical protein J2T09_005545 [Neorhizobium huautlense]|uniref:GXWXG protein n=1 Tax=Neorhizobium huautlense TaxID=67774 RepID=A0ABT9Q237_9HYPH|nr:GXWXG domain-containing protein [Neorhizobium huautlense]MDP9840757.1 hypothetical protein [Neorhizobium huautlense]